MPVVPRLTPLDVATRVGYEEHFARSHGLDYQLAYTLDKQYALFPGDDFCVEVHISLRDGVSIVNQARI